MQVRWGYNSVSGRLPSGAFASGNLVDIPRADRNDGGIYYCYIAGYPAAADSGQLVVNTAAPPTRPPTVCEFRCGSGECVARSRLCDGRSDCIDASDEANCVGKSSL